jgi:hypothetical protein
VTRRPPLGTAATVAGLALMLPAAAPAATISTSRTCLRVIPGQPTFPVVASGFTPGAVVRVTADGRAIGSGIADGGGVWSSVLLAPLIADADRVTQTFRIEATDTRGVVAPSIVVPATRLTARLPPRSSPTQRVPYRAFGFEPGQPVFLHVRRGGRTRGSFRLGAARGPCGAVVRRMRFMPLRNWSTGRYEYWFTHTRRFTRDAEPAVALRVRIFRRPGARDA